MKLISTTAIVSRKANLGHVQSGACCAIQTSETHIAVTKVFINLNVNLVRWLSNMFKTTDLSSLLNGFIRNILPSKPGGLITTPFWSYIIISQSGADPRRKSLQESMGAWGGKSSRPNPDKSFVTPVYARRDGRSVLCCVCFRHAQNAVRTRHAIRLASAHNTSADYHESAPSSMQTHSAPRGFKEVLQGVETSPRAKKSPATKTTNPDA